MAARLCPYFLNLAAYAECVEWAQRVLTLDPPPSPPLGLLQQHAGTSLYFIGDRAGARALFEAAVRTAASAGDEALRWSASLRLGRILVEDGDVGEAEALMAEAIARLRPVAQPRNLVWALSHYAGSLTLAGSADRALPLATEALEIARGADLEYAVGQATLELARISLDLGDDIGALGHAADCAARFAEAGDRDAVAYALSTAADALARLGLTSDAAVLAAVVDRIRTQLGLTGRTAEQESLRRLIEGNARPRRARSARLPRRRARRRPGSSARAREGELPAGSRHTASEGRGRSHAPRRAGRYSTVTVFARLRGSAATVTRPSPSWQGSSVDPH